MSTGLSSIGDVMASTGLLARHATHAAASKNMPSAQSFDKTAKDFESMFMAQMLQPMWEGVEVNSEFGGGHGEEVMRGFMIQEYGKSMAQADTSGLKGAIKDSLIRAQAKANGATANGGLV